MLELLGVLGTTPAATRADRAVKGVGALICDFFGVSITCLLRLLNEEDDKRAFAALGDGVIFVRRLAVMKG